MLIQFYSCCLTHVSPFPTVYFALNWLMKMQKLLFRSISDLLVDWNVKNDSEVEVTIVWLLEE